ncbi:MAG: tyrosine--tRNA ligase [Thermonemataceae bacterium]
MKNFVEELRWRGMLHDMMPETEAQLQKEMTAGNIGFDPTAASLHIGNLATIMLLVHFQKAGHKPFALVGGATGMIGDPSGKSAERQFLSVETLQHNQACIKQQLEKFLDFDAGANAAEMVNNYDWFQEIKFLDFLRDVGKRLTVNYMMAKDSVKNRLTEGSGISFTEFSYQLLQGYDFYHLYKHHNCKLQMGGSDQWGNITTGTELIRRIDEGKAYALTCPLLTKADGTKFGKSEQGNVWLDASMTSPYKFYQFWLNVDDKDLGKLLRVFSLKEKEAIEALETENSTNPNALKRALAEELTARIHGEENLAAVVKASSILFSKDALDTIKTIDEALLLEAFDEEPQIELSKSVLQNVENITDFLSSTTQNLIFSSKGEVRRAIQNNAVSINKVKVKDPNQAVDFELLRDKYIIAQNGKRKHYLIKVV